VPLEEQGLVGIYEGSQVHRRKRIGIGDLLGRRWERVLPKKPRERTPGDRICGEKLLRNCVAYQLQGYG